MAGLDMSKFLQESQQKWGAAVEAAESFGGVEIPDGTYIFKLTAAELGYSKKNNPQIVWDWLIMEGGDQVGNTKKEFFSLGGENSLQFLARRWKDLGIDPDDVHLPQLEAVLAEVVAREYYVQAKLVTPKGTDYQNLRNIQVIEDYDPDSPESGWDFTSTQAHASGEVAQDHGLVLPEPTPVLPPKTKTSAPTPEEVSGVQVALEEGEDGTEVEEEEEVEDTAEMETAATTSEDDEDDLKLGMKVKFTKDGVEKVGTVKSINETDETADIKVGTKTFKAVLFEDMEIIPEPIDAA